MLLLFLPGRRTPDRANRLKVQTKFLQCLDDKVSARQLFLDRRMNFRPVTRLNDLPITVDPLSHTPVAVATFTHLRQQLAPGSVVDSVFGLNALPQGQAEVAELARWLDRGRGRIEHGESVLLFSHKSTGRRI